MITLQEQMQVIFDKLAAPAVIDAPFVVVYPEQQTAIEKRPQGRPTAPPARSWGDDDGLTVDHARVLLAGLLHCPFSDVRILDEVGRCVLVEYTPLGRVDPDIVLTTWPSGRPINRAIVNLQQARMIRWPDWGEFWRSMNDYIADLTAVLTASTATGAERAFILAWAYRVRDTGAALAEVGRRDNGWY